MVHIECERKRDPIIQFLVLPRVNVQSEPIKLQGEYLWQFLQLRSLSCFGLSIAVGAVVSVVALESFRLQISKNCFLN